ncbi:hypothetical protein SDRG_06792 [Saprolegnia diclina VS20]|uniref:Uncharacterized protein n=1 Tax=Saprolegnia diclina (strain VS20) TaxID=1156394 RepID=T0QQB1_SAPDV|nr:hypothetical protein SDRG_06792 [Saprolegnia diclina VS20]EQC36055.1 hypothetical protein SDRG_06792 [Saprolegnia diclina VS20]|eukprot:XP_008610817.1 hypothetical protein SDRG_06792 [Saprolegnia diclina VS20]
MDPASLCHYSYKACYNVRDRKRNGDLHKLCAFHRCKANASHRKHVLKRASLTPPDDDDAFYFDMETIQMLLSL